MPNKRLKRARNRISLLEHTLRLYLNGESQQQNILFQNGAQTKVLQNHLQKIEKVQIQNQSLLLKINLIQEQKTKLQQKSQRNESQINSLRARLQKMQQLQQQNLLLISSLDKEQFDRVKLQQRMLKKEDQIIILQTRLLQIQQKLDQAQKRMEHDNKQLQQIILQNKNKTSALQSRKQQMEKLQLKNVLLNRTLNRKDLEKKSLQQAITENQAIIAKLKNSPKTTQGLQKKYTTLERNYQEILTENVRLCQDKYIYENEKKTLNGRLSKLEELQKKNALLENILRQKQIQTKKNQESIVKNKDNFTDRDCLQKLKQAEKLALGYQQSFEDTYNSYYSSNYFHVGPRYALFNFCRAMIDVFRKPKEKPQVQKSSENAIRLLEKIVQGDTKKTFSSTVSCPNFLNGGTCRNCMYGYC